ncbi:type I-C CRISPR-associated protein Cas7/Csd2 [Sphingomonas sp.]|uniref:type I-C CRISPR-associated protein Cas7/Csd2 n=1 Tax=Sphingomonas sp. TaxID=28214 RepID=UPI002B680101|nr:type I-C CRISPR-associated protein Cas7/Csd2 [Sphingomonas sp.]HTG39366.1 type I-C CRISPR-associated protein Cas7/Csd2 [Sphingomonas sp.]
MARHIRTFGAVLSTGINAGQVRGPVQITFARSVEPVLPLEISITRMAATNAAEKEKRDATTTEDERTDNRTMGRKHIIPYGLYRAHGFVSAPLASHSTKGTGFTEADLALLWEALGNMFEHDRSAARGEMATRALIVFEHEGKLGNAHADALFSRVTASRKRPDADGSDPANRHAIGSSEIDNWPPARSFDDYAIALDEDALPPGVKVVRM